MSEEEDSEWYRLRDRTGILADYVDYHTNRYNYKRVKSNTTAEDRLSALPDFLILHILSFLTTKEVVRTCLLSKRWQFIWTGISKVLLRLHVSGLDDVSDTAKIGIFVDFVGRMLAMCKGLNTFGVRINCRECACHINFWVDCLVKNKVKEIALICFGGGYELPQMFFSYSSLTNLLVDCCVMTPRGAIEWGSLKSLSIEDVELSDCVMEKILSGCPVLEFLSLKAFWGLTSLNICSPNLATLVIEEHEYITEEIIEVSAPYVRNLSILKSVEGMRFRLKNISSVVRAYFEFYGIGDLRESDKYTSPESMVYLSQLFRSLQSVKELELGTLCTEVLSVLEMKGWKIPPDSTRLCLTLNAFNHEGSIPGILGILKSSPYLETLVIEGEDYINYDEEVEEDLITRDPAVAYLANGKLDLILNRLKTIKINSFTESVDGQPMLTLVRLLLKSAKVLEKMIIKDSIKFSSPKDATYLAKIASRLLTFPRASPEAVVMF